MGNSQSEPKYVNITWTESNEISDKNCESCNLKNFNFEKENLTNYLKYENRHEIRKVVYDYSISKKGCLCKNCSYHFFKKNKNWETLPCYFDIMLCLKCNVLSIMNNKFNSQLCNNCIDPKCLMCCSNGIFKNKLVEYVSDHYQDKFTCCDDCWFYEKEINERLMKLKNERFMCNIVKIHIILRNLLYEKNIESFLINKKKSILIDLLDDNTSYISMLNKDLINDILKQIIF